MNQNTLTKTDLRQFTGTEQWHRHGIARNVLYTDGALQCPCLKLLAPRNEVRPLHQAKFFCLVNACEPHELADIVPVGPTRLSTASCGVINPP